MAKFTEPEIRHGRQYMSFVGYRRGQNHVERGKAIGLDDQHAVCIDLIEIAHLPAMHELKRLEAGFVEGLVGAHDGGIQSREIHDSSGRVAAFTASDCLTRNACRRLSSSRSASASIETANNPAFAAPPSPIAKVATGMPLGICTMDSSESRPPRCLEGIGTASTGKMVKAATTPARCAAPPAPAMKHLVPADTCCATKSASRCGVRCADKARASNGMPKSLS